LQLTYFDEENEEVSINSQADYEEALKSAARQGNRLHMNVYETRGQPARVPTTKASSTEPKRGFRPPQHCPALTQVVSRKVQAVVPEQGMMILKEVKGTKEEDKTPPAWFTLYMEKFKDQVVREAVEKICREFSGQCCIHKPLGGGAGGGGGRGEAAGGAEAQQVPENRRQLVTVVPEPPSLLPFPFSPPSFILSSVLSVCTSCTLCEPCSFAHDPSHNLVRARTPLSIPEHGSPAPDHSRALIWSVPGSELSPGLSPGSELSPGLSPGSDLSPGLSPGSELSPGLSPGSDLSSGLSPGSELSPGLSPGSELSPGLSPGSDLSSGLSPGSELSPGLSPGSELSPGLSPVQSSHLVCPRVRALTWSVPRVGPLIWSVPGSDLSSGLSPGRTSHLVCPRVGPLIWSVPGSDLSSGLSPGRTSHLVCPRVGPLIWSVPGSDLSSGLSPGRTSHLVCPRVGPLTWSVPRVRALIWSVPRVRALIWSVPGSELSPGLSPGSDLSSGLSPGRTSHLVCPRVGPLIWSVPGSDLSSGLSPGRTSHLVCPRVGPLIWSVPGSDLSSGLSPGRTSHLVCPRVGPLIWSVPGSDLSSGLSPGRTSHLVCPPGQSSHLVCPPGQSSHLVCPPGRTSHLVCPPGQSSHLVCPPGQSSHLVCPPGQRRSTLTCPQGNIRILLMMFYRRGDRSFRKAEKQRLKAEKRLLKAEVKEIRKQLRMERRGIQWSSSHREGSSSPVLLQPRATQHSSPERPKRPCPLVVPTMTATFLDENLPDGTRLRPGTKFIKYWKMRNTGTISWSADTKLKFMWGNLAVGSGDRWREVSVPFLQPGQVGIVSVALCGPGVEGSYTSHWRLAHGGEQFGPRVWCSIVVDPLAPAPMMADGILVSPCVTPQGKNPAAKDGKACAAPEQPLMTVDQEEYYIPSVDLLTAQDLLSFELLDINIVQELESVPNNTPADMTPCMSPLPQDGHLQDKSSPSLGLIQEETEVINSIMDVPHGAGSGAEGGGVPAQEEGEDDISGTQFVCETVIRSMTLEEAPTTPLREGPARGPVKCCVLLLREAPPPHLPPPLPPPV
ncbi:hypothetical protein KUCAC02_008238, partial [Chaenocephalus aceratus]